MFQSIDQVQTGIKINLLLKMAGYDVKFVQSYLNLSCPQSIYRWFKGKVLPSVEHLHALSKLLNVHMEELLVPEGQKAIISLFDFSMNSRERRIWAYAIYYYKEA